MSKDNTIIMTKGNPYKLMLRFALPLMLGNVFQQMYTLVDTMVVGKGVGVDALASVGAADWLNWMCFGRRKSLPPAKGIIDQYQVLNMVPSAF